MILQAGSTIKVGIELPVATRHRCDMTEKLLKVMLNSNTHTHTQRTAKTLSLLGVHIILLVLS